MVDRKTSCPSTRNCEAVVGVVGASGGSRVDRHQRRRVGILNERVEERLGSLGGLQRSRIRWEKRCSATFSRPIETAAGAGTEASVSAALSASSASSRVGMRVRHIRDC